LKLGVYDSGIQSDHLIRQY